MDGQEWTGSIRYRIAYGKAHDLAEARRYNMQTGRDRNHPAAGGPIETIVAEVCQALGIADERTRAIVREGGRGCLGGATAEVGEQGTAPGGLCPVDRCRGPCDRHRPASAARSSRPALPRSWIRTWLPKVPLSTIPKSPPRSPCSSRPTPSSARSKARERSPTGPKDNGSGSGSARDVTCSSIRRARRSLRGLRR